MMAWLGFLWLLFLCILATWALAAGAATALTRSAAARQLRPEVRGRRALLVALLPWLVPLMTAASIFVLAAAKPLGLIADHCLYHGPGHPHLCLEHLPAVNISHLHLLAVIIVLTLVLIPLSRYLVRERRMAARLRSMHSLAHGFGRLRILEAKQCLALAANARDPFVLMSRGLIKRLTRHERRIVLAHEVAHLRHRDLLRNHLFEVLLLMHLPWAARKLRVEWRQALEERADDRVAARFGADSLAQALVRIVRLTAARPAPALSVSGADPLRRIERLLSPQGPVTRRIAFESFYIAVFLAVAVAVTTAHHALETLLGFLTGS